MAESKALLLASASLIGIFLINIVSDGVNLEFTDISEIDSNMLNEVVHVRGVVKEYRTFSAGIRLLLEHDGSFISVVHFGEAAGKKGMCADVVGEVKTTDGTVEIIADRLSLFIC